MWWLALTGCGEVPLELESEPCPACDGACIVESVTCDAAAHVEGGVDYADVPPMCGDHDPCWTTWGVHASDPGDERWVHNLEHGGVVFLYDCPEGCDAELAALTGLVTSLPDAVLAPADRMPERFGVVAWGARWLADCVDLDAMTTFYEDHRGLAPESVTANPPENCIE